MAGARSGNWGGGFAPLKRLQKYVLIIRYVQTCSGGAKAHKKSIVSLCTTSDFPQNQTLLNFDCNSVAALLLLATNARSTP